MDFNFKQIAVVGLLATQFILAGCTGNMPEDNDENVIGSKLEAVTSLRLPDGSGVSKISIFDQRLRKIHQFDLDKNKRLKTLPVVNPQAEHFVLQSANGRVIMDFTKKSMTIYTEDGVAQKDPIVMQGKPISAAYDDARGTLVIYDDLMSVGIIKLNAQGVILNSYLFGSLLNGESIVSGELLSSGKLLLALDNADFVQVDIDQSLATHSYVFTSVPTEFTAVSWIARATGNPNNVLVKYRIGSDHGMALVNANTGATVQKAIVGSNDNFKKLSKSVDGHAVTTSSASSNSSTNDVTLIYTNGTALKTLKRYHQRNRILSSQYSAAQDEWTLVDYAHQETYYNWDSNEINAVKTARSLNRIRVTDNLVSESIKVPDKAQIILGLDFFFALFPSDLGYAYTQDVLTGAKSILKGFNVRHYD